MKLTSTSIYNDGQAGRIEIKIAKLEWQTPDANVMVVVRGKALLVRLDQPGVGATTFERLGNNQTKVFYGISSSSVFAKDFWQILKRKRSHE